MDSDVPWLTLVMQDANLPCVLTPDLLVTKSCSAKGLLFYAYKSSGTASRPRVTYTSCSTSVCVDLRHEPADEDHGGLELPFLAFDRMCVSGSIFCHVIWGRVALLVWYCLDNPLTSISLSGWCGWFCLSAMLNIIQNPAEKLFAENTRIFVGV